jgi:ankyrin repeat protein
MSEREFPSELRDGARHKFVKAAHAGDVEMVMKLWCVGLVSDVDCRSGQGRTALLCAATNGHVAIAQFLLERGAATESRNHQSLTSLHLAARKDNVEMVDLLCQIGADVNADGLHGKTPLHIAVAARCTRVVSYLLDHPAIDLVRRDAFGNTVLLLACIAGDENFVTLVVKKLDMVGATDSKAALINMPDADNATPLIVVTSRGYLNLAIFLIAHGADLDIKDVRGSSPLRAAARWGHADIVRYLLESGAHTETVDSGGNTPLIMACHQ